MAPRLQPLLDAPITFAHRGARAHAPENTLEAFRLALRLGARGLESDVWVTADGVAVLDHDGVVGPRWRRKAISTLPRAALPSHIPSVEEFYDAVGTDWPFSVDVKDPNAFAALIDAARNAGGDAEHHLWICHPSLELLVDWRRETDGKLVNSTRLSKIPERLERRAARLREDGIDAINLRHNEWSGGFVTLVHRFGRYAFGWDAQHLREIANLIDAGIDGVFSDYSDRMFAVASEFFPEGEGKR